MATPITDVFGRHSSTQDVIAGIGLAPRSTASGGRWRGVLAFICAARCAPFPHSARPIDNARRAPIRRVEHTHDT
jgi:hypothetical protein